MISFSLKSCTSVAYIQPDFTTNFFDASIIFSIFASDRPYTKEWDIKLCNKVFEAFSLHLGGL
jgi:hypothetical protein